MRPAVPATASWTALAPHKIRGRGLRSSAVGRLLRSCGGNTAVARLDLRLRRPLARPICTAHPRTSLHPRGHVAQLALRDGGLGLHSAALPATTVFWASWVDAVPVPGTRDIAGRSDNQTPRCLPSTNARMFSGRRCRTFCQLPMRVPRLLSRSYGGLTCPNTGRHKPLTRLTAPCRSTAEHRRTVGPAERVLTPFLSAGVRSMSWATWPDHVAACPRSSGTWSARTRGSSD